MTAESRTIIVQNSDNEASQPIAVGGSFIGCVDEVKGRGSIEVPEYVPTRSELKLLLKYWIEVKLQYFYYGGGAVLYLQPRPSAAPVRLPAD